MRRISISIILLALLGAGACTRELAQNSQEQGEVVLRIALDGLDTKSAGTDEENAVNSLQLIIFSEDGNTQYYSQTISDPSLTGGYYEQSTTVSALTGLTGTPQQKTNALKVAKVFAVANYPNGPISNTATLTEVKDLSSLSADNTSDTPATGKFVYLKDGRYRLLSTPSFVMTAEGGFVNDGGSAVASLQLKRLAAKVSLTLKYAASPIITDGRDATLGVNTKTVWTPLTDEDLRVYLDNAVMEATLGGPMASPAHFTYADNHPTGDPLASAAFYTYPATWTEGSGDAPFVKIIQPWHYQTLYNSGTESAPVPVVIDENVVELYYKVMFPGLTALESNTWYQPTVTLNVLGGEAERPKELIPTGFDVLPWGNASAGISTINVQPVKYLTIENDDVTVTNGNKVQVRYFASGPVTLTVNRIYKEVFTNTTKVEREIYPNRAYDSEKDEYLVKDIYDTDWFLDDYKPEKKEGVITLNHELSTDFNATNFAGRPYIYSLTLSLDGGGAPAQSFTITQYPSILVGGQHSYGCVYVNNTIQKGLKDNTTPTSLVKAYTQPACWDYDNNAVAIPYDKNSFIRIYGFTNATGGNHGVLRSTSTRINNVTTVLVSNEEQRSFLGSVSSFITLSGTSNVCQYRIIVQASPVAGKYIISPRIKTTEDSATPAFQNLDNIINNSYSTSNSTRDVSPFATSTSESDATHTAVKAYQPGIRVEKGRDYIAPEFMVASSWGKTWGLYFEQAVLRCASYQEDGYPAGRWRLPTEAELWFIMKLSNNHAIPDLVSNTTFASSGRFWDNTTEQFIDPPSDSPKGYSRCVYDTWYWGRGEDKSLHDGRGAAQTINGVSGRYLYPWSGFVTAKRETLPPSDEDF